MADNENSVDLKNDEDYQSYLQILANAERLIEESDHEVAAILKEYLEQRKYLLAEGIITETFERYMEPEIEFLKHIKLKNVIIAVIEAKLNSVPDFVYFGEKLNSLSEKAKALGLTKLLEPLELAISTMEKNNTDLKMVTESLEVVKKRYAMVEAEVSKMYRTLGFIKGGDKACKRFRSLFGS